MKPKIHNGRWTTPNDDEVVLFLVGIRANRLRSPRVWLPVVRMMRPMLRELEQTPDSGLLGYRTLRHGLRETAVLLYWRSVDELMEFADGATHRRAWQEFYRKASRDSAVGIWHETFVVPAGRYEAIYGNVPQDGLAAAHGLEPIRRRKEGARARLGESEPA